MHRKESIQQIKEEESDSIYQYFIQSANHQGKPITEEKLLIVVEKEVRS